MEEAIYNEIFKITNVLRGGGVILYPTDTIWGLGCDATNANAIHRIFEIKKRSPSKSMIILVDGLTMIQTFVRNPSQILLDKMLRPTIPTTGIFRNAQHLPPNLVNADGSIGIRIASDDFCKQLIGKFGKPIVSTSANISNKPSPSNFSEIDSELIQQVDYTVHYRRDDDSKKSSSAIIRLNSKGEVERIR